MFWPALELILALDDFLLKGSIFGEESQRVPALDAWCPENLAFLIHSGFNAS